MAQTEAARRRAEEKREALKAEFREELMREMEAQQQERIEQALREERERVADAQASSVQDQVKPAKLTPVDPFEEGAVTVHFLEDGLTLLGEVRYRGQELTVRPGTSEWDLLTDPKLNKMILELTEVEQVRRWGKRFYAEGLWPYDPYDIDDPNLSDADRAKLRSIQEEREARLNRRG